MKPSPLTYHRPTSLDETLVLLASLGPEAKVLAGGQSLVPLLSMRLAAPAHLVDVNAVPGLDGVTIGPDGVRVGALVRHARLERDEAAGVAQPLLREALRHVAHPTIRNRGTTVGSIVHADPSAEMPAVLTLLGGSVDVRSTRGARTIGAGDLFAGPLECTLAPDELAVSAWFPACGPRTGTSLVELARRHGDYAVVGVVVAVTVDAGDVPVQALACYVSVGETGTVVTLPVDGSPLWAAGAARHAAEVVQTGADVHASAAYRRQLVQVLTGRALLVAAGRARAGRALPVPV